MDEVREGELTGRTFVLSTIVPYLARRSVDLGRAYARSPGWWPDDVALPSYSASGYLELLDAREFSNLLAVRYAWLSYVGGSYERALSAVDDVLLMVRRDLTG